MQPIRRNYLKLLEQTADHERKVQLQDSSIVPEVEPLTFWSWSTTLLTELRTKPTSLHLTVSAPAVPDTIQTINFTYEGFHTTMIPDSRHEIG